MNTKETSMQWSRRVKSGEWYKYSSIHHSASHHSAKVKRDFRPGCWFIIPHSRTETVRVSKIFRRLNITRARNNLCRDF